MRPLRLASLFAALVFGGSSVLADVVTEWNTLLLDAIRNESTSPPLAACNLAIFHTAIYDAVNAIERTHQPYFISLTAPAGASAEAAAVGAAYECLADLYPSQIASFDTALNQFLTHTADTTNRADGLALGEGTARRHRPLPRLAGPRCGEISLPLLPLAARAVVQSNRCGFLAPRSEEFARACVSLRKDIIPTNNINGVVQFLR